MPGSVQVFVDLSGASHIPHVFLSVTDGAGNIRYYGYAPVSSGSPVGAGTVSTGLVPAPGQPANSVAGYMDQVAWSSPSYVLSDTQLANVSTTINNFAANNPNYAGLPIFGAANCATFVNAVLAAGEVNYPLNGTGPSFLPSSFIARADLPQFYSNGSLLDTALNPKNYAGTPAYNFIHGGGTSSPSSGASPAISDVLQDNADGSVTETIVNQDGSRDVETNTGNVFVDKNYDANASIRSTLQESVNASGASAILVSGQAGQINASNAAIAVAGNSSLNVVGSGDSISTASGSSVSVTSTDPSMMTWNGHGYAGSPDSITTSGSGNNITLAGSGSTTVNGSGNQVTVNPSSSGDTVNGNDSITLINNSSVYLGDGATDTVSGQGTTYGSYGNLNVASNASVTELGNSEAVTGSSTDTVNIGGTSDTFTGAGATLNPQGFTSLEVNGADNIYLGYSDIALTANGSSIFSNTNYLSDLTLFGSNDSIHGTGIYDSFLIGGSSDSDYLNNTASTFLGTTTNDYNFGASSTFSDIGTPDTSYFDFGVSFDDPIVLNLTGAKVQTQNLTSSTAYFDVQNIGSKVHTGWGTAGEGYLFYDPNNTNSVTNEQSLVSSFAALKSLDSNLDGVLNSLDAAWSHLKVWVDSAGNGSFSASALHTVSQLGIASISLNSTHVNTNQNNNTILDDSTFTWNNGSTGDIAGVDFNFHAASVTTHVTPPPVGCVQVDSALPCGTRAGNVKVGSTLQLADEVTLAPHTGEVSFSKVVKVPGVRITTQSGISLVCSESAPIPTPQGFVLAPNLFGMKVPTCLDGPDGRRTDWETVEVVQSVGEIEVQHITVGDKCFWAGEKTGAYILHHNRKIQE